MHAGNDAIGNRRLQIRGQEERIAHGKYGVAGLHFYTLNKARSAVQIARNLGLGGASAQPS